MEFIGTGAGADASAAGGPPALRVRITNAASGAVRLDTRFPLDFLPGLAAFVPQARAPPRRTGVLHARAPSQAQPLHTSPAARACCTLCMLGQGPVRHCLLGWAVRARRHAGTARQPLLHVRQVCAAHSASRPC
jgi:hypothetical protein